MAEGIPSELVDPSKTPSTPSPELWRYGSEDMERVPFGGPGLWRQIGPAPLYVGSGQANMGIGPDAGLVVDIAIDPTGGDNVTIYIATNGGIWKSTTGGASWQPLTDFLLSSCIGAVALDPLDPQIVYAGSGNMFDGAGSLPKSAGLFKSLDGGATWAHMDGGLHASVLADKGIVRMICPAPNALLVATSAGLYFSRNGGVNFGANEPIYDDGKALRDGFITALIPDSGATAFSFVTGATGTGPIVINAADHGFQDNDRVYIGGVTPTVSVNGSWLVDRVDKDNFSLRGSTGAGNGAVSGIAMGLAHPAPQLPVQSAALVAPGNLIVIQSTAHGFLTGDIVAIHGVAGTTSANRSWQIKVRDADHFELVGSKGNAAYTGGGIIDGPSHPAPQAISTAKRDGTLTVNGHKLVTGDQVTVTGLPGIAAPNNSGSVTRIDDNTLRIDARRLNADYTGGGFVSGPAVAWNSAYFVSTGAQSTARGLFRLTLCSDSGIVYSDNLLKNRGGPPAAFGNVVVTQSLLPRPRTLFISVQNGHFYTNFFHSADLGQNWTVRPVLKSRLPTAPLVPNDQSDYDMTIGVDPQDNTHVYAALQELWRTAKNGETWDPAIAITKGGDDATALDGGFPTSGNAPSATLLHGDHHAMLFAPPTQWKWSAGKPATPTPVYFGTDGGLARSDDGTLSYVALNEGLANTLFRDIDIARGPGNNAVTFGGMQDLGTGGQSAIDAELSWNFPASGDGDRTAIDPANPLSVFGFQNNHLTWTPNGGESWFVEGGDTLFAHPVITQVRNTNPIEVATTGHPFQTKDSVTVSGVVRGASTGAAVIANGSAKIERVDNFVFKLTGKNGAGAPFDPVPAVTGLRCLQSRRITDVTATAPIQIETSSPHGLSTGNQVHVEGVLGVTSANNTVGQPFWPVEKISDTRFSITGSNGVGSAAFVAGAGRVRGPAIPGQVPIQLLIPAVPATTKTPALPIVIIAINHGFVSGDAVTVTNVRGTTKANTSATNPNWIISVIDANSFTLQGSTDSSRYVMGPRASGKSVGRSMGNASSFQRMTLLAGGGAPTLFVSQASRLLTSLDGGINFTAVRGTPWPTDNLAISSLAAPDATQLWVGVAEVDAAAKLLPGRVFFRGGPKQTWFGAAESFVNDVGASGPIACIAVDPADNQHVAVVASSFSATHIQRRTRHCFVTTTGGRAVGGAKAWTEVGGVFSAPSGNLPDVAVMSAAWVKTGNQTTLMVASDGAVLRLNGNQWQRVGPNLPNVFCQAMRVDNTVDPSVVRVGTYGRSVWELVIPTGPKLMVRAQLGFGERRVGQDARLPVALCNAGVTTLSITHLDPVGDFSFDPPPALPLNLNPGESKSLTVRFRPSAAGRRSGVFQIVSNDPDHPQLPLPATGVGVTSGAGRLSVRKRVDFGLVTTGTTVTVTLDVGNTGLDDLNLTVLNFDTGNAAFSLAGAPVVSAASPLKLAPGEVRTVNVQFAPTAAGLATRILQIGPTLPEVTKIRVTGSGAAAGSTRLLASVVHFLGVDDGDDASPEVLA